MPVSIKRVYEPASPADGARVLVDRLWPRGVRKEEATLDLWLRDLAPSDELRKWYHQRPSMWRAFRERYLRELREPAALRALEQLYQLVAQAGTVTLLFASKDEERNNAVVVRELLDGMRKPPRSTGPIRTAGTLRVARARR